MISKILNNNYGQVARYSQLVGNKLKYLSTLKKSFLLTVRIKDS